MPGYLDGGAYVVVNNRLTGAQLRAARGLLALSAEQLAVEAGVSLRTIRRIEKIHGPVKIKSATETRIVLVLKMRGVVFLPASGSESEGVRLRKKPDPEFA